MDAIQALHEKLKDIEESLKENQNTINYLDNEVSIIIYIYVYMHLSLFLALSLYIYIYTKYYLYYRYLK